MKIINKVLILIILSSQYSSKSGDETHSIVRLIGPLIAPFVTTTLIQLWEKNIEKPKELKKDLYYFLFTINKFKIKEINYFLEENSIKKIEFNYLVKKLKKNKGFQIFNNYIFYGPPGNGKNSFLEYLAKTSTCDLYIFNHSYFLDYKSEYGTNPYWTFENMCEEYSKKSKKNNKNCILFIDEIDLLANKRSDNPKNNYNLLKYLTTFDKKFPGVLIVAATNKKDNLDEALIRKGRFDIELFFDNPTEKEIHQLVYGTYPNLKNDLNAENLINKLNGQSYANIKFFLDQIKEEEEEEEDKKIDLNTIFKRCFKEINNQIPYQEFNIKDFFTDDQF